MPELQEPRRGILQTQINRCTSNVTPSPAFAGYDGGLWYRLCIRNGERLLPRVPPRNDGREMTRERLFRLLLQLRVRTAEIGRGRILAGLDDAAADRAGAGEMLEQCLAVTAAAGAREVREVLAEGAEHFQHRLLVGEEDVAPHDRVGGRD